MKKEEVVYIVPPGTEKEILRAEKLQQKLYNEYDSVEVYPHGLCEIKIVGKD